MDGLPATTDAAASLQRSARHCPRGRCCSASRPSPSGSPSVARSRGRRPWQEYDWEIVHEGPISPNEHLALDQVLTEEVGAGRRGPTLRIWEWDQPAVVIGSFQSLKNEVDPAGAAKYGVEVVRRISGGGAMFMDAGAIISYSLYVPTDLVQGMTFADSYAYLDEWVIEALKSLGIEAYYQPLNDISSTKGKIGGAAQKRLGTGACCTTRR